MALVVKDRVKVTTTTTGTGTITLGVAQTGFSDFSGIGDGNTTYYAIMSGSNWEVGIGTYTASGTTLSRDTILDSSNGGSAINLSGTSDVFCTYPAEYSVSYDKETVLTGFLDVPAGTTGERPSVPDVGMIRFNTTVGVMESYDGSVWRNMYEPAPEITSVSPTDFDGETGTTITVNGNYFSSGAVVQFKKTGGSYGNGANISFINSNQITAQTTEDYDLTESPISVKVVQDSGSDELVNAITMGSAPVWSTPSGNLVTVNEGASVSTSVSATDDGSIASYGVVSGALPSGVSLNTSTGAITGTAPSVTSNTVYNFTIRATDNVGNTTDRAFSITVNNINYTVSYLMIAGGGCGGGGGGGYVNMTGGGGAGGLLTGTQLLTLGTTYSFTVGGGAYGTSTTRGGNTTGFGLTCIGGGMAFYTGTSASGGCGGGSGCNGATYGAGTAGQGYRGGTSPLQNNNCGGGGGTSAVGGPAYPTTGGGGVGGAGTASSITGSTVYYGGGGGGGTRYNYPPGGGGIGGGTAGLNVHGVQPATPAPNLGAGGGGFGFNGGATIPSNSGGSGVVILSIPTASYSGTYTGSVNVTTSGSNTILKFTGSGSYTA